MGKYVKTSLGPGRQPTFFSTMADAKLSKKQGIKRKGHTKSPSSRKKIKTQHDNADDLAWTTVKRPFEAGVGGDDGILELEEVEDVEVVYEETEKGRVARFNVRVSCL